MDSKFNLLDEPWIPVVRGDGQPEEVSLQEVLVQAHNLVEINALSPLVVASLHRLLLAIVHRVFGPADHDAWAKLWSAGQWDADALSVYFARWHQRFNLFDDTRPFFQCSDAAGKEKPITTLMQEMASTSGTTLFDHHIDSDIQPISAAKAICVLLTQQTFTFSGTCGSKQQFTDAPWARGAIFFVKGRNLFETLALNAFNYPDEQTFVTYSDDAPIWEQDNPWQPGRRLLGYLDYLTWPQRRIRLIAEEASNGKYNVSRVVDVPGIVTPENVLDPMKVYYCNEKYGWIPLKFTEDKALWRDSTSLFRLTDQNVRQPAAFRAAGVRVRLGFLNRIMSRQYTTIGTYSEPGRDKIHFWRYERMPLQFEYLENEELTGQLKYEILSLAESIGSLLQRVAYGLAQNLTAPSQHVSQERLHDTPLKPHKTGQNGKELERLIKQIAIERYYWSMLEIPFRQILETMPNDPNRAQQTWDDTLLRAARTAFEQAAQGIGTSARALKAVTLARGLLDSGLKQHLPIQDLTVPE